MQRSSLSHALVLASALALTASATAQVTATIVTKSKISVGYRSGKTDARLIDVNKDVSKGFSLDIETNVGCFARAASTLEVKQLFGGLNVDFNNFTRTKGTPTCNSSAWAENNDIEVTFRSKAPIAGHLVLTVQHGMNGPGKTIHKGSIDVGSDGNVELEHGQRTVPVVLDARGISITMKGTAVSHFDSIATSTTAVLFVPKATGLDVLGAPCKTAQLGAYLVPVHLSTQGLMQLQTGKVTGQYPLFVFGVQQLGIKLPPHGCMLYTDLLATVGTQLNSAGQATLRLPVPASVKGTFRTQFFVSAQGGWQSSNAISIKL